MVANERLQHTRHLHFGTLDSTNAEGMRRAAAGEQGPLWITTDEQLAGRGRSLRPWLLPRGNLAATLVIAPGCRIADLQQLALLAGVAVHDAITEAAGHSIANMRLKWPNDIMIDGAKVGGILVETTTWASVPVAVIGIGLNVAEAPVIEGRDVARLADYATTLSSAMVFAALDVTLTRWLEGWAEGRGFAAVRSAWLQRTGALGESIAVNTGVERIEGTFAGIDDGGVLLLRDATGVVRALTYGDVSLTGITSDPTERKRI